jgi:hypothetical protein
MAKKYAWGDGRGRVHSIPLKQHKTDVKAMHALGGSTDLTAPPSGVQAYREAQAAATAQFGPQVAAAKQQQTNIAPWFKDYMARVAGYAQAANQQAQPVIDQAQTYQTGAAAQTAPGLDPNSEAGQQAAQAASGRQALAQLGLDALNTQNTATQNYLGGLGTVAAKELPRAQTAAANALANAKSQRGAAVQNYLTTARQNAQNYQIAEGTLGLNTTKAQADAAIQQASVGERTRHDKAGERNSAAATKFAKQKAQQTGYGAGRPGLNKFGFTYDQWTAMSPAAQGKARAGKDKGSGSSTTGPYGVKLATPAQITKAHDRIAQARGYVNDLKNAGGFSRGAIRDLLLRGGKVQVDSKLVQTYKTDKNGNPVYGADGKPVKIVKKVPVTTKEPTVDALYLDAALELAYDGGLSRDVIQRLHKAGYMVNRLGLPLARPRLGADPGSVYAPGAQNNLH